MDNQEQATQQEVKTAADNIVGTNPQATQAYIDDQLYMRDTLQSYLNRIKGKDQKDTERQRQIFVTMSRGIIGDIQAVNPQIQITRSGEHTWKGVFDVAWEALYPTNEEPTEQMKEDEPMPDPQPAKPQGAPPVTTRRSPGDVVPVEDGEELEAYVEKLGLESYADLRNDHTKRTKTLKTSRDNLDALQQRMDEKAKRLKEETY